MSADAIVVTTSVADARDADALARGLVDARLAACVQVVPGVRSTYRWDGAVRQDDELQLVIKTSSARFDALAAWLATHHPYDVPEVVAVPVARGSRAYLDWIAAGTADGEAR